MFALVEDNKITQMPKGNKGITIDSIQYPASIYTLWSEAERNVIGIYTVEIDNTNRKDEAWYINTNITYAFSNGKVTGSYGTATAKAIEDANAKDENGVELDPVVVIKGLKTIKKEMIDQQCAGILQPSDWRVIRAKETGGTMNSGWKTWRASVRTKCNSMQTQIDGATNVDELKALFEYTNTGTEANPVYTRPLGEFPEK
jgi:peptidoglycan hydrolase-like protein with peptidoglycan-binding domain